METAESALLFVLPPTSHFVPPLTSLSNTTKNPAAVVNLPIGINLQRGKNLVGEVQGGERADLELPTWQAQISGAKTWYLQPPPECSGVCRSEIQGDLHPGDMIIVNTNFWFHKTLVLEQGISLVVTQQVG